MSTNSNKKIIIPKGTLNPNETTILKICNSVNKTNNNITAQTATDRRQSLPKNFKPTDTQGFKPPNFLTRKEGSPIVSRCPASAPQYSSTFEDSSLENDLMPGVLGNQAGPINRDQKDMYNKITVPVKTPWQAVPNYGANQRQGFAPCSCSSLIEGKNLQMEDINDISALEDSNFDTSFPNQQSYGNDTYYTAKSQPYNNQTYATAKENNGPQVTYVQCPINTSQQNSTFDDVQRNNATYNTAPIPDATFSRPQNVTYERRCSDKVDISDNPPANSTFNARGPPSTFNETMNESTYKKRGPCPLKSINQSANEVTDATFTKGAPNQTFNVSNGSQPRRPCPLSNSNQSGNEFANATFTKGAPNQTFNVSNGSQPRRPCPLSNSNQSGNEFANATFTKGAPNQTFNISNGSQPRRPCPLSNIDRVAADSTFVTEQLNNTFDVTSPNYGNGAAIDDYRPRGPCPLKSKNTTNSGANGTGPCPLNASRTIKSSTGNSRGGATATPGRSGSTTFNSGNDSGAIPCPSNKRNVTFQR